MFNSKAKYLRYINIIGILERYIERNTREKINEHFFRSISHYYRIRERTRKRKVCRKLKEFFRRVTLREILHLRLSCYKSSTVATVVSHLRLLPVMSYRHVPVLLENQSRS